MEEKAENPDLTEIDELYRLIGKFTVMFESLNHTVMGGIFSLMLISGVKNQGVIEVIVADLTVQQLRSLYQSLINEVKTLSDLETEIIRHALNMFNKLNEQRNAIIHSNWSIANEGWGVPNELGEIEGVKLKKNKTGVEVKITKVDAEELKRLITEAKTLSRIFLHINDWLLFGRQIEDCFSFSDDGTLHVLCDCIEDIST